MVVTFMNPQRLLLLTLLSLALLLPMSGCRVHPLGRARQQVPIGMPREEAIRILGSQAWYHQPCGRHTIKSDLFFFGSHQYDRADVVIVTSYPGESEYVVVRVDTFYEANAWHTAFADCLQRDQFDP